MANVALARASSVVVVPEPLAIAGVARASFGFTLFNGLEEKGEALLNAKLVDDPVYREVKEKLLPGPAYQTNYIVTMEYVARATKSFLFEWADFDRYRRLQILTVLKAVQMGFPLGNALARIAPAAHKQGTGVGKCGRRNVSRRRACKFFQENGCRKIGEFGDPLFIPSRAENMRSWPFLEGDRSLRSYRTRHRSLRQRFGHAQDEVVTRLT